MEGRLRISLLVAFVVAAYCPAVCDAQKLDGRVAYSLGKIGPALDKAEKLLDQGDPRNAEAYFDTAQTEWEGIHRDFKDLFDPNHPDIVATRKRLEAVSARLKSPVTEDEGAPTAQPDDDAGAAKPPPAAMAYVMKQIHAGLDAAEKSVAANDLRQAEASFDGAEARWKSQQEWNVGQYDPQHPDVVALVEKLNRVGASVRGLGAEAADAAEQLPLVLAAITQSVEMLQEAHDRARARIRRISSLLGDYDRGMEDDFGKLRLEAARLRLITERINSLLPAAAAAAKAFREQFPDFSVLGDLVRDGAQAGQTVQRLEAFPANWLEEVGRLMDEALEMARENVDQYGLANLQALAGQDENVRTAAADGAEKWVMGFSSSLLDLIPLVLPELPKEAQAVLPELAKARADFLKRAAAMRDDIAKVSAAVREVRQDVVDAQQRRLAQARFPTSKYHGGQWDEAEKHIRKAWAKAGLDKQLIKIDIYLPWEERTEARWRNQRWIVGTYRYIGAHCLAKLPSDKYMVYRMSFRNTRQRDGTWSELRHWGVGHVYEILPQNIDKQ